MIYAQTAASSPAPAAQSSPLNNPVGATHPEPTCNPHIPSSRTLVCSHWAFHACPADPSESSSSSDWPESKVQQVKLQLQVGKILPQAKRREPSNKPSQQLQHYLFTTVPMTLKQMRQKHPLHGSLNLRQEASLSVNNG